MTSVDTDPAYQRLSSWIQPQHLTPSAVEALAERFQARPERYLHIDDFLMPGPLERIRDLIQRDGIMKPFYRLYGDPQWIDKEAFERKAEKRRFIFEEIFVRPKPGKEMGASMLAHLGFLSMVDSSAFQRFLGTIIGDTVAKTQQVNLKRLNREHFLREHSDEDPRRSACMVLYLHEDWREAYGGQFAMYGRDRRKERVAPLTNRVLIFDPNAGTSHEVEPMNDAMEGWSRMNYTAWFLR